MWSKHGQSGSRCAAGVASAVVALAILTSPPVFSDDGPSTTTVNRSPTSPATDFRPPASPTLYDGRTLTEWRERIKRLDFKGPEIDREVPGLLAIARDPQAPWFNRRQAALTLGRIGAPAQSAIPDLIELLQEQSDDPEQSTQLWVIKALGLYGPVAGEAAPALVAMLDDSQQAPLPRLASIEALGRIGPARPEVFPAITRALDAGVEADRNHRERQAESAPLPGTPPENEGSENVQADTLERAVAAAEMLELFRGQAASATPSLIRATASNDVLLRRAAANTLGLIGPAADPAIPALADLVLFDELPEVRDLAARSLGRIGAAAEPVLVQLLQDTDVEVRMRAAIACRELRTAAPPTIVALHEAAGDSEPIVRIAALESLWSATSAAAIVAPPAIQELAGEDREIRMRAVRLLESVGPQLSDWIPQLQTLAADERSHVSQAATRVLRSYEAHNR